MDKKQKHLLEYSDYLVKWIQKQVTIAGFKGVVVGISGGIDSAVVAALAKRAFPQTALGLIMPIETMGQDFDDAQKIANEININIKKIDLTNSFVTIKNELGVTKKLAVANIKPRLRMVALYAFAQEKNMLVLGTDNAAEWLLGYFTKYGDGGADLLPIVHLTKGEVRMLAKALKLPRFVLQKRPSAGLWPNQIDEAELGLSYNDVDAYIRGKKVNSQVILKIKAYESKTSHKRHLAMTPQKP